jgi:hypothetical protein
MTSKRVLEALAATDRKEKYFANSERGLALLHGDDGKPKPEQLQEGGEVAPDPPRNRAQGTDRSLRRRPRPALMGHEEDAAAMFQRYVDAVGIQTLTAPGPSILSRNPGLQCAGRTVSIQRRNRPAKQVRGITLVEPTFIEQGPSSYTWLGVQRPPVRNA